VCGGFRRNHMHPQAPRKVGFGRKIVTLLRDAQNRQFRAFLSACGDDRRSPGRSGIRSMRTASSEKAQT